MYNFIRKNQKKMMAVFGVVLMIAFIVPSTFTGLRGDAQGRQGHIGDENITHDQIRTAEAQWDFLARHVAFRTQQAGQERWQFIVALLPQVAAQMQRTPEVYFLLQYEARKMGLVPNLEEARQLLSDPSVGVLIDDGSIVTVDKITDSQRRAAVEYYVANLLMVNNAFARAAQAVKISQPLVAHELAAQTQQMKVRAADFLAKDYVNAVGTPTEQQLQEQFDRFSNFESDAGASTENPFGFGYKYPDRVKLQYIGIPRQEVRKTVEATKTKHEWNVQAHKYYNAHLNEFPTTLPTTEQAAAPTTAPFDQVQNDVLDRVIDPMVDRLQRQIESELTTKFSQDYEAFTKGQATTPAYNSFEYLQAVAGDIQERHKVTLTVASIADSFRTRGELRLITGIGQVPAFPDFVMAATEAFVPESERKSPAVLSLFKATNKPMHDEDRNGYIFRIIEAQPAHKPASLAEVRDQVERDWKHLRSYELAQADAEKLLQTARQQGLETAAGERAVVTTGAFSLNPVSPIENYPLSTAAQTQFIRKCMELLGSLATKPDARPMSLIGMPPDAKVAVAELVAVESRLPGELELLVQAELSRQVAQEYQRLMAPAWFHLDSVMQRLNYVDDTGHHAPRAPATQTAAQ